MTTPRVLITGAAGFIGRHLVADQLARGRRVRALDREVDGLRRNAPQPGLDLVAGDVSDPGVQSRVVAGADVVFHLASAHLDTRLPDAAYARINVSAVRGLLEASRKAGVRRFVHVSSCGIHGSVAHAPANEDAPFRPDIPYERTKLAGELLAREFSRRHGFPVVIARPAWVYGPGCKRTARLFGAVARRRFVMVGQGTNRRSAVFIADMVDALERCATREGIEGEAFIIAHDEVVTVNTLVSEIARLVGVPGPRLRVPTWLALGAAGLLEAAARAARTTPPLSRRSLKFFTTDASFTSDKARKMLGFDPRVPLRAGLDLTHRWLLNGGGH